MSHAYLFVGAPGSGKIAAAEAVAKSIVCPHGGDGTCEDCIRVSHHTHPDVHWYKPQSASGYLIGQVREIISDVMLAPIKAQNKVYVLDRADLLRTEAANALLKTIEEPPRDAIFILCARSTSTVPRFVLAAKWFRFVRFRKKMHFRRLCVRRRQAKRKHVWHLRLPELLQGRWIFSLHHQEEKCVV